MLSITLLLASANSLPGDWLYGVKQFRNQISLLQAQNPADHAAVIVQQLRAAIADLRAEIVSNHSDTAIVQALTVVQAATNTAQSVVAALPRGTVQTQAQSNLDHALADERGIVQSLLKQAHWAVRVALTSQLGMVGGWVPSISSVMVVVTGNDQVVVTIDGMHFAPGAFIVLDGNSIGSPQAVSPTHITLKIATTLLQSGSHHIGIQNPDGTAAEYPFTFSSATPGHPGVQPTSSPGNGRHGPPAIPTSGGGKGHAG